MSAAVIPIAQADATLRVSLFADYYEVWQGTVGELCAAWNRAELRPSPSEVVAKVDAQPQEGAGVLVGSLPDYWFSTDLRSPNRMLRLKRAHYYQDQKTGSLYTCGDEIRGGDHWNRRGPIKATLGQTRERQPMVTISTGFGFDGDYTPAQVRAYAKALLRIADDAEKQPMGPRSFCRSVRGYDA